MNVRQLRGWLMRLFGLFHRNRREREFAEELESHLAMHIEDNLRAGMSPQEARCRALIKLGGVTQVQELHREQRGLPMLETLFQDLRFGARMLFKNPGFSLIAIVTLALGIGANTAIFSVCNAVLFKPLPYAEPDRLLMLSEKERDGTLGSVASANFVDWRDGSRLFSGMGAVRESSFAPSFILGGQGEASRLAGGNVSSSFFSVLGVQFMLGRNFLQEEERLGHNRVAILSYATWSGRFGADRDIVGKTITLDDESYTAFR